MALMGRMMSDPLLISSLLRHAERHSGETEIVSKRVEGDLHRSNWREVARRSRQAAQAFARLGCEPGDRVATLAWNGHRHMEIYYGSSVKKSGPSSAKRLVQAGPSSGFISPV